MKPINWPWPVPQPGIYFGMSFADYLAIPAMSNSGIKDLLVSGPNFWASSWLNPFKKRKKDTVPQTTGRAYHARVCEGKEVFYEQYAPKYEDDLSDATVLRTGEEIKAKLEHYGLAVSFKRKEEGAARLLAKNPALRILENLDAAYRAKLPGREFIDADLVREIELGARAIELNPHLNHWLLGGHAEVVIIWIDKNTGIPYKIRFDYLKIGRGTDLKTVANEKSRDFDKAIDYAIAGYKYPIQAALYLHGAEEARKLIAESKVFGLENVIGTASGWTEENMLEWLRLYRDTPVTEFGWIMHQKGQALTTEGRIMVKGDSAYEQAESRINFAVQRFMDYFNAFGQETPWISMRAPQYLDWASLPAFINDL